MNNDWQKLLSALEAGLRDQVMPHVGTERAQVQLNAVIYVLSNLRLQGAWKSGDERESHDEIFVASIDRLSAVPEGERDDEYHRERALLMAQLRRSVQDDCAVTARSMMLELSGSGSESVG